MGHKRKVIQCYSLINEILTAGKLLESNIKKLMIKYYFMPIMQ